MKIEELKDLYEQISEDIRAITITHFAKLHPTISRASLYWFITKKPNLLDNRTQKSMQKYYKIIYDREHEGLKKIIY